MPLNSVRYWRWAAAGQSASTGLGASRVQGGLTLALARCLPVPEDTWQAIEQNQTDGRRRFDLFPTRKSGIPRRQLAFLGIPVAQGSSKLGFEGTLYPAERPVDLGEDRLVGDLSPGFHEVLPEASFCIAPSARILATPGSTST